jgi:hypothetical protein
LYSDQGCFVILLWQNTDNNNNKNNELFYHIS